MSITINGTQLGDSLSINNTNLSQIILNNVVVWESGSSWDNRGLEYNSWDTIQDVIQKGQAANKFSVGDTKTFVMNNKTYTAEVVSINTGIGDASQYYPEKTVDFICVELYEDKYNYNSNGYNSRGFPNSNIKSYLNDDIYPLLPQDLKDVIIEKNHIYQTGRMVSGSWQSELSLTNLKLWLPTYYELHGSSSAAVYGEDYENNKQYTLNSISKIINGTSDSIAWWLGTPYTLNIQAFFLSEVMWGADYTAASDERGVPICFRIG